MFKLAYSKHTAIREFPNERDALMLLVHPQLLYHFLKLKAGLVLAAYTRTADIATNLISCSLCSEERARSVVQMYDWFSFLPGGSYDDVTASSATEVICQESVEHQVPSIDIFKCAVVWAGQLLRVVCQWC